MKPEIINISLQRTATQSFEDFSIKKGFSSKHYLLDYEYELMKSMPLVDAELFYLELIKDFDSISDMPIPLFLKSIIKKYPHSKYVFIKRDSGQWADSVIKHQKILYEIKGNHSAIDQLFYNRFLGNSKSIPELSKKDYELIYNRYCHYVEELFNKNSLMVEVLDLNENLSVPMNALFDEVRKTEYRSFEVVDYAKSKRGHLA